MQQLRTGLLCEVLLELLHFVHWVRANFPLNFEVHHPHRGLQLSFLFAWILHYILLLNHSVLFDHLEGLYFLILLLDQRIVVYE